MTADRGPRATAVRFALAVHVLVDLVLLALPWQFTHGVLMFVVAWPMSQNALITTWAITSSRSAYHWRYLAVVAGASWTWFVCVVVMPDVAVMPRVSAYSEISAAWAVVYATQSITIVVGVMTYRTLLRWLRRRIAGTVEPTRLQFGVGCLLVWTALIAVTFGCGRAGFLQFGWNREVVHWPFFVLMPGIGFCNAVCALMVLFSLADREQFVARAALAVATIATIGYLQLQVQASFFGRPVAPTAGDIWILAGSQAAYLYGTLLPLRSSECSAHAAET